MQSNSSLFWSPVLALGDSCNPFSDLLSWIISISWYLFLPYALIVLFSLIPWWVYYHLITLDTARYCSLSCSSCSQATLGSLQLWCTSPYWSLWHPHYGFASILDIGPPRRQVFSLSITLHLRSALVLRLSGHIRGYQYSYSSGGKVVICQLEGYCFDSRLSWTTSWILRQDTDTGGFVWVISIDQHKITILVVLYIFSYTPRLLCVSVNVSAAVQSLLSGCLWMLPFPTQKDFHR